MKILDAPLMARARAMYAPKPLPPPVMRTLRPLTEKRLAAERARMSD